MISTKDQVRESKANKLPKIGLRSKFKKHLPEAAVKERGREGSPLNADIAEYQPMEENFPPVDSPGSSQKGLGTSQQRSSRKRVFHLQNVQPNLNRDYQI